MLPENVIVAIIGGCFALPATITAYIMGTRKQTKDADAQFDQLTLTALGQREATILAQNERIQNMAVQQSDLFRQLGATEAQIKVLTTNQEQRDARERDLLQKLGALESRVSQYASCDGGSPCPFRHIHHGGHS